VFGRNIPKAVSLPPEEIAFIRTAQGPFFSYVVRRVSEIFARLWVQTLRPALLSFVVKAISRLRIVVLRIEQQLLKLVTRIRSRSILVPKPSEYWQEIYSWKNTATVDEKTIEEKVVVKKYRRRSTSKKKSDLEGVLVKNEEIIVEEVRV
jgi:hypothetical protein